MPKQANNNYEQVPVYAEPRVTAKTASVRPLSTGYGPVPVAQPNNSVQLTPVVQPIAFVPYSTQQQPMFMFEDDNTEQSFDQTTEQQSYEDTSAVSTRRGIKITPIILALFNLIIIAILVVGQFFLKNILALSKTAGGGTTTSGYGYILKLFDMFKDFDKIVVLDLVAPIAIAVAALCAVLGLIGCIFGITKRSATILTKISSFIILTAFITFLVVIMQKYTLGIGLFIVAGVALLQLIIAFSVSKTPKRK